MALFNGLVSFTDAAELYYTNRTFTVVGFANQIRPADMLNTESKKLTNIVKGAAIQLDSNGTYAIERNAVALGHTTAAGAWNAAVNYNYERNHNGKIFDNVGWVRGTKLAHGEWGAYLWTMQNKIAFLSSTSAWWTITNDISVAITNVMVGSLGDYGPVSNVVDIGPSIPTNYPGANQNDSGVYQVDITNVCYQLSIPDIWIMPRYAVTNVGGSNVQYTVTGTNIPQGVTWSIFQTNFAGHAVLQTNVNWHLASVIPGSVATNYKVRATSKDNTNFYDQVDLMVVGLQSPLQYKIGTNTWADIPDPLYVCKDTTVDFKAIKIPTNASWPNGKPVWGGVVSGSGVETNSYTFSTISTSATDYKIVSAECGNTVTAKVVVGWIEKIKLGGATNLACYVIGKVYIPTKWGGSNTIAGDYAELFYTDGSDLNNDIATRIMSGELNDKRVAQGNSCVYAVPTNQYKWYYVKVTNSALVLVSNSFVQSHTVSKTPWSCPWYPMSDESSPNLYDSGECLERYDTAFGTASTNRERISVWIDGDYVAKNTLDEQDAERTLGYDLNNADGDNDAWTGWGTNVSYDIWNSAQNALGQDGLTNATGDVSWWGHCDMATAVIICENEPTGNYTTNEVVFTPELKKGLLVALYHGFINQVIEGYDVLPDLWHKNLEEQIIGNDKMIGSDVYNSGTGADIIWNYPVYAITKAEYKEKSEQNDEKVVEIKCESKYWTGTSSTLYYWYNVGYNNNGIASSSTTNDWKEHPSAPVNKKKPDSVWVPTVMTNISAFWGGQLNYTTIRNIVSAP